MSSKNLINLQVDVRQLNGENDWNFHFARASKWESNLGSHTTSRV